MALNLKLAHVGSQAAADALVALLNGGFLDIYDGAQPATPNTAISTQNRLASLTYANPAFGASVNGVATANAIGTDTDADATGTAAWFRAFKSDHTTAVLDGSVGVGTFDVNIDSTAIQQHAQVAVSSQTITVPE